MELVKDDLRECVLAAGGFMLDKGVDGTGVFEDEWPKGGGIPSFISDAVVMTEPASDVVDPRRASRGRGVWNEGGRDDLISIEL
jgi:hypothetical protein